MPTDLFTPRVTNYGIYPTAFVDSVSPGIVVNSAMAGSSEWLGGDGSVSQKLRKTSAVQGESRMSVTRTGDIHVQIDMSDIGDMVNFDQVVVITSFIAQGVISLQSRV